MSQGGSADEGVLIEILSTIAPPFNMEQIKSQALWAATQAVLLINEHKVDNTHQYRECSLLPCPIYFGWDLDVLLIAISDEAD